MNKDILILDIETDSPDPNIAKLKWFGCYSTTSNKYYLLDYTNKSGILDLISQHNVIVGFNNKAFDNEIINNYFNKEVFKYKTIIDLWEILAPRGNGDFGINNKNRLVQMGIKLKNYKLKTIVEYLKLDEELKGEIDYKIFMKDFWTEEEKEEIKKYLKQDIILTKKLFEWVEEQFDPLKKLLPLDSQKRYKHITAGLSSLGYQIICYKSGLKIDWTDKRPENVKSFSGGHHIENRKICSVGNIVSIDFTSAYPHALMMGNLFSPVESDGWNGKDYYHIEGCYDNKEKGKIEIALENIFLERLKAKKEKDKPKSDSYKIIINCFSEDTEIMTIEGLKKMKDCKVGDIVYSINTKTEEVELKPIEKMYEQNYIGDMIHFKDRNKDLIVTPNHDMLFKGKGNMNYIQKIKAKDVINRGGRFPKYKPIEGLKDEYIDMKQFSKKDDMFFIKLDNPYEDRRVDRRLIYEPNKRLHYSKDGYNSSLKGKWFFQRRKRDMLIPEFIKIKDLFYFIGIVLSEGSKRVTLPKKFPNGNIRGTTYDVCISQNNIVNKKCYDKIEDILKNMNIRFSNNPKNFIISSKFWYDFFKFKINSLKCNIPEWCFKYDSSLLKFLHLGLYDGDGNKNQYRYTTISKKLKDDVVCLNLHLGYRVTVSKEKYLTQIKKIPGEIYRIFRTGNGCYRKKENFKYIQNPTNKIISCSVKDNHTILAGRNGKLIWTGQSIYGLTGNYKFKSLYNPISASDCTSMVRTWIKKLAKTLEENGFYIIYGFTDNLYVQIPKESNLEELKYLVNKFIEEVKLTVPFPMETFNMEIEKELKMIWFAAKNCYLYVTKNDEVEYKSTILNQNTPQLIMNIFNNYMKPKIIKDLEVNFTEGELNEQIKKELQKNIELAGEEYNVRNIKEYKVTTSLHYQISERYGEGRHYLIPNLKGIGIGKEKGTKISQGVRYCTIDEFKKNNLTHEDIEISKLIKHFKVFIKKEIKQNG